MTDVQPLLRLGLLAALLVTFGSGCHSAARRSADLLDAKTYEQVVIRYEVNGADRLTSNPDSQLAVLPVSATSSCDGAVSHAALTITYPHPQFGFARAQVQLRLSEEDPLPAEEENRLVAAISRQLDLHSLFGPGHDEAADSALPGSQDEIWALDISRDELTTILDDLATSVFFEDQTRSSDTAELSVKVDRQQSQKVWTAEPVLDELIRRVHINGNLAGFLPSQLASK